MSIAGGIRGGIRIGLPTDVIICFDIDFCSGFHRLGSRRWARRRGTASVDGDHSLYNIEHFGHLTLSILEILRGDDWVLTLVLVVVGKRIVQLVVRVSNGAGAKED